MKAKIVFSYDNINPSRNMAYFDLESFQFSNILATFNVHIPNEIAVILNGISIRKMTNYMVPPPGMMLEDEFYEQGFTSKIDCSIFGFQASY